MNLYSQDGFFIYKKIPKQKVSLIEKKFNSEEKIATTKHVVLQKKFKQPIIFDRPEILNLGKVMVCYYYVANEGIVKMVSYDWDVENSSNKEAFFKIYGVEFDKIVAIISRDMGKPQSIQDITEKVDLVGTDTHFERRTVWENSKCHITTLLLWSNTHNVLFTTTIKMKN